MIGYSYNNGRESEGIVDLYWSLTTTSRGKDGISVIENTKSTSKCVEFITPLSLSYPDTH